MLYLNNNEYNNALDNFLIVANKYPKNKTDTAKKKKKKKKKCVRWDLGRRPRPPRQPGGAAASRGV